MGIDWKIIDLAGERVLDIQGLGGELQHHCQPDTVTEAAELQHHCQPDTVFMDEEAFTIWVPDPESVETWIRVSNQERKSNKRRRDWPYKGVYRFVNQCQGKVRLINEHHPVYDDYDHWEQFSLNARTGHHKREGYGPVA